MDAQGTRAQTRPGIGLALGGGVIYTIAGIGVFRVLEEAGMPISAVSGTSGGAIIGSAIAAGLTAAEIERVARKLRWTQLAWPIPGRLGLLNGSPISRFVERLTGCRDISELRIPFTAVCADVTTGEEVRFTDGPLGMAVQGSCCIPGLFQPVCWEHRLLVDGGIVDNVPVEAVREHRPLLVVAVDVLSFFEGSHGQLKLGMQVVLKAYQMMVKRISESQERRADMVIKPNVAGCSYASFRDVPKLIERGEEAMRAVLPRLRAMLEEHESGGPPLAWEA